MHDADFIPLLRLAAQDLAEGRLFLKEQHAGAVVLFARVQHFGPGRTRFDTSRVAAAQVAFEHLATGGDKDRVERTGRHTLHALDALVLVNNGRLGDGIVVERVGRADLGARRGVGAVVADLGRKAEAVLADPRFHGWRVFNLDACPQRVEFSLGRVDERTGYLANLAIGAQVLQGEELFVNVGNLLARLIPDLPVGQLLLGQYRHTALLPCPPCNPFLDCLSRKKTRMQKEK